MGTLTVSGEAATEDDEDDVEDGVDDEEDGPGAPAEVSDDGDAADSAAADAPPLAGLLVPATPAFKVAPSRRASSSLSSSRRLASAVEMSSCRAWM